VVVELARLHVLASASPVRNVRAVARLTFNSLAMASTVSPLAFIVAAAWARTP
jgi:hypothetical protein